INSYNLRSGRVLLAARDRQPFPMGENMRFTWLNLATLAVVLSGCSSGGSGGGGGNSPTGKIQLNSESIAVTRELMHGSGDALVVTGSLTDPSGDVYLVVDASQTRLIVEVEVFIDGESGRLHLWPTAPGDIGPGTHEGKITVKACSDAGCTRQYP